MRYECTPNLSNECAAYFQGSPERHLVEEKSSCKAIVEVLGSCWVFLVRGTEEQERYSACDKSQRCLYISTKWNRKRLSAEVYGTCSYIFIHLVWRTVHYSMHQTVLHWKLKTSVAFCRRLMRTFSSMPSPLEPSSISCSHSHQTSRQRNQGHAEQTERWCSPCCFHRPFRSRLAK